MAVQSSIRTILGRGFVGNALQCRPNVLDRSDAASETSRNAMFSSAHVTVSLSAQERNRHSPQARRKQTQLFQASSAASASGPKRAARSRAKMRTSGTNIKSSSPAKQNSIAIRVTPGGRGEGFKVSRFQSFKVPDKAEYKEREEEAGTAESAVPHRLFSRA